MSDYLSTTAFLPIIEELGRGVPSRESQISFSLFHPPTCKPIGRTRNIRYSPIRKLNYDVLLNIFYLCRLDAENEEDGQDGLLRKWDHQRWWYKLTQVSRQWRHIILASPSRLKLCLLCTYGVPVADMLAHSPPLPLAIFYYDGVRDMTPEDEEGALLALLHRDRVRRIALRMLAPKLEGFITAMDRRFPILERLYIHSLTKEEIELELPKTFQTPNLHYFDLQYTALPTKSLLLTSTGGLVHLWLGGIPRSAYFSPNYIVTRLLLMPQLETLGIEFNWSLNRNVVRQLSDTPTLTDVTLPNLRLFTFVGVSAYLEGLLAQISAPVLGALHFTFFNQLTFTIRSLLWFMLESENLIFKSVKLVFDRDSVDIIADPHRASRNQPLRLRATCRHLDWQVAFAVQILGALSPVLTVVEELVVSHVEHDLSSEWHNEVERTQWRELLRPFSGVKTLHVQNELFEGLSCSLCSENGEMCLELLPNLQELQCSDGSSLGGAFTPFIIERQTAGHPLRIPTRYMCPECGASYVEKKALNRHCKDTHSPKNVCTCGFRWAPGRNYLFDKHVRMRHGGVRPHFSISTCVPNET
jgi:hypothetical protein